MSVVVTPAFAETELRADGHHLGRAVALNRLQAFAIANPSPDPDSIVELLALIRPDDTDEAWAHAGVRRLVERVNAWNARERQDVERAHDSVETLASGFRSMRLTRSSLDGNGALPALSVKAIAARLRVPLRVLASPSCAGGDAQTLARQVLASECARFPSAQLLSGSMRHELGLGPHRLLRDYLAETNGAGALGTPGSETHGDSREPAC